jgi:hypothetical protein
MKKTVTFALFIFVIGIVMTAGCVQSRLPQTTQNQSNQAPSGGVVKLLNGTLNVSTGSYDANVTLYIDDTRVGEISPGKPFKMSIKEGRHTVKICLITTCEQVDVEIKYAITTAVDFGELLLKNIPNGPLVVSIGDYIGKVTVYIDDNKVGEILPGKYFNMSVREGPHTIKVYSGGATDQQDVVIKSGKETVVDFGEQLTTRISQGRLRVSIGGFNIDNLPVYLDDIRVGEVSQVKPLDIMVREGNHTVRICVNIKCKNESVDIRFAKQSIVDYSEWLKKEVEFVSPTVRIVYFSLNGNYIAYNVEWINPTPHDVSITTTVGVGYSYIESTSRQRRNDFARVQLNRYVNANSRTTQPNTLYLSGGSNIMASEPTIVDISYQ